MKGKENIKAVVSDISVVIPNYNNAKFLEQCIDSVYKQTYPAQEIIVVDDCSTDNSRELLYILKNRYPNLKVHCLDKNCGVSNARNVGLSLVSTSYITFIDADDFYVNDRKLENEMELIKNKSVKYGKDIIAYSITVECSSEGMPDFPEIHRAGFYLNGHIHFQLLMMWKWKSIMRDYCVLTSALKKAGEYNVDRNLFEDWELLIKLSKSNKFFCTMQYGTGYRNVNGGLSSRPATVYKETINDIFETEITNYGCIYRLIAKITRNSWNLVKACKHMLIRRK